MRNFVVNKINKHFIKRKLYADYVISELYRGAIDYLLKSKNIKLQTLRVGLQLSLELNGNSYTKINQSKIASALNMKPQNVYRSIQELIEINFLIKREKSKCYMLNSSEIMKY